MRPSTGSAVGLVVVLLAAMLLTGWGAGVRAPAATAASLSAAVGTPGFAAAKPKKKKHGRIKCRGICRSAGIGQGNAGVGVCGPPQLLDQIAKPAATQLKFAI